MPTLLSYGINSFRSDSFNDNKLDGKIIGICREDPIWVLNRVFDQYCVSGYKSLKNPLQTKTADMSYGLNISSLESVASYPALDSIIKDISLSAMPSLSEKHLQLSIICLIDNYLLYPVSDGPVYNYMKMRKKTNLHVGPGSPHAPDPVHVGPGKKTHMDTEPCGIGHTGGSHEENYLFTGDGLKEKNPRLDILLSEILEVAKVTLGIETVKGLRRLYSRK